LLIDIFAVFIIAISCCIIIMLILLLLHYAAYAITLRHYRHDLRRLCCHAAIFTPCCYYYVILPLRLIFMLSYYFSPLPMSPYYDCYHIFAIDISSPIRVSLILLFIFHISPLI